jgi:hypothetical protein
VQLDHGHIASPEAIDHPGRHGNTWTVLDCPLVVVDETAVDEGGVDADKRNALGHEGAEAELLPMPLTGCVVHWAGLAGDEQGLVARQHLTDVIK